MSAHFLFVPILILVISAILSQVVFKQDEKKNHIFLFLGILLTSIATWVLLFFVKNEKITLIKFTDSLDVSFGLDGLGKIFAGMVSFLWPLAMLYAYSYMKHERAKKTYFMFYTLTYAVVLAISFSRNLLTLYIFYEMLTFCTLPLITQPMTKASNKAGRYYMYYSLSGSALAFIGLMFIINYTGGSDFVFNNQALVGNTHHKLLMVAYLLSFLGFGVKSAIFPLHGWLPLASHAPTPTTALLHAVAVVKSGVFALMRLTYYCYGIDMLKGSRIMNILMALAIFTILYGSCRALKESHFKRRLAYSTISNLSYIIFAITLVSKVGLIAAVLHMVFHSICKITLFFGCGDVMHKAHVNFVYELDGLGKKMKTVFVTFFIASLSLTGIPLLAGFISKIYIAEAAIDNGNVLAFVGVIVLIISALLTAIYSLSIPFRAFLNAPKKDLTSVSDSDLNVKIPLVVFSILCFVLGIFSSGFITLVETLVR